MLEKKLASELWELELEKTKAEAEIVLKHSVITKELRSQNKKENLLMTSQIKSRVDVLSPNRSVLSPGKSRILTASRSQKLLSSIGR